MSTQKENEDVVDQHLKNPDGYWALSSVTGVDNTTPLLQEFVRRRLLQEYGKQFRAVAAIPDSDEKEISRIALSLVIPLTQLFIVYHHEKHHGTSWRNVSPKIAQLLEQRLQFLLSSFQQKSPYFVIFQTLLLAIDSNGVEHNKEVSRILRECAVTLMKHGYPILLITLDTYLAGEDFVHLEPDIKVFRHDDQYAYRETLREVGQALTRRSHKIKKTPTIMIGTPPTVFGGWMLASQASGDNILPDASVIIPSWYKYTPSVLRLAQVLGISMTEKDVQACMVRAHAAHEGSHGYYGDNEFVADRVGIPIALNIATTYGANEYWKQLVFILADLCCSARAYGLCASAYIRPQKAYEQGYIVSAVLFLDALAQEIGVGGGGNDLSRMTDAAHIRVMETFSGRDEEVTIEEAEEIVQKNPAIAKLYAFVVGEEDS